MSAAMNKTLVGFALDSERDFSRLLNDKRQQVLPLERAQW
jgi:hypothetical protein